MKTKRNLMKKLMLFAAAFAFCTVLCVKPMDIKAAISAPLTVSQQAATNTAVGISWSTVGGATKYGVQIATSQSALDSATEYTATKNSGAITNLKPATTYYVRVRAYSSSEVSVWSKAVTVYTAPNNITSIKQTNAKQGSVTFTWSPVSGVTGYKIYRCLPNGTYSSPYATVGASTTSYTMSVEKNSLYYVTVVPTNHGYDFPADNDSIVETYCVPAPTAPKKLTVTGGNADNGTLEFGWNPTSYAENTHGYKIEVYKYKKNGKKARIAKAEMTRSAYESSVLYNGGYSIKKAAMHTNAICFRVCSYVNINGKKIYGNWSSYKNFIPQAKHLKLSPYSRTNATLSWKKVTGATSYDVYYKTSSSDSASWKLVAKGVKGTSVSVPLNYYGRSYYYVKTNKVFGKKKFTSAAPKKAPYVTYWSRY